MPETSQTTSSVNTESSQSGRRFAPLWVQWLANILFILLILSLGFGFFQGLAGMKTPPPREEPKPNVLRVQTYRVESAPLKRYIASFGTAQPDVEVTVSAEVSGKVTEKMDFEVGSEVNGPEVVSLPTGQSSRKLGSLLIQIDSQTYLERVRQVENLLNQNEVSLQKLNREEVLNERLLAQQKERLATITAEYERILGLYKNGVENETRVNQSRLELEQYRESLIRLENEAELIPIQKEEISSQRATHESDLKLAELEFDKATVRVPVAGTISEVFVEEGQYVRTGDPLVEITTRNRVEIPIAVSVEDADILQTLIKQKKFLTVELVAKEADFIKDNATRWSGSISRIDPIADEQTRTVQVFVEVENSEQQRPLRPGTFVYARIEADLLPANKGLLVPRDALLNGILYVATGSGGAKGDIQTATVKEIEVDATYQVFAFVTSGLSPGEEVITTNLDIITEGSLLNVRDVRTLDGELQRLRIPYLERAEETAKAP